jgi:hypothetical protein
MSARRVGGAHGRLLGTGSRVAQAASRGGEQHGDRGRSAKAAGHAAHSAKAAGRYSRCFRPTERRSERSPCLGEAGPGDPGFLSGDGQLGRLIAEYDWSRTPLAPLNGGPRT